MASAGQDFMVIPRSSKPARIQENFDIFDFELSEEQMRSISEAWQCFQVLKPYQAAAVLRKNVLNVNLPPRYDPMMVYH